LLIVLFFIAPGNKRKCNDVSWLYKDYIAHRGVFNNEEGIVENTKSAFLKAVDKHYSIETDLHLTKDERIIIFHDNDFKRMSTSTMLFSNLLTTAIWKLLKKSSLPI
ncbi:MAG: glycerophosphodiester phosphodiesterase, partial [Oscillospiraceae bacterium]|nr:glycerophosphodiester phosphodiesterase [Oscillospiraceae bacterium]